MLKILTFPFHTASMMPLYDASDITSRENLNLLPIVCNMSMSEPYGFFPGFTNGNSPIAEAFIFLLARTCGQDISEINPS